MAIRAARVLFSHHSTSTTRRLALTTLPRAAAILLHPFSARTMASVPAFTADAASSHYASGPFPVIPRTNGIAAITSGAPSAHGTVVRFATKDAIKAAAGEGAIGEDATTDSVYVQYVKEEGRDRRVVWASVGAKSTVASLRKAAVAAVTKLRALKVKEVEFEPIATPEGSDAVKVAAAVVQAAALTNYAFDRYLTSEAKVPHFISALHFSTADAAVARQVEESAILAAGTIFARDLANERADEMHPSRLEDVARQVAAVAGMSVFTCTGPELVSEGLHMLHAVGQAARHAPRYIELFHAGDPSNPSDVIAVVGKGVCYDTGGLNIKGTGFMEDMHMDMAGSAAVLGAALSVHRFGLKRNVVFVVGAVENAIDALSYKPHCILRSHKGITVENGNTDAEGRLVLADALSYVQQRRKPHTIIDLATLTGACVIALGEPLGGAFSNSKALREALIGVGASTHERLWPMPILAEHRAELTGTPFADVKSTGESRYGGASNAAAFLEMFIGFEPAKNARDTAAAPVPEAEAAPKPSWCHLDIAGPAAFSKPRGHMNRGGTGFGVQLITQYLRSAPAGGHGVREADDE
jgi:leucyl aminopeptidase